MVPMVGIIKDWRSWGLWSFDVEREDINGIDIKVGRGFVVGMFAFAVAYPR